MHSESEIKSCHGQQQTVVITLYVFLYFLTKISYNLPCEDLKNLLQIGELIKIIMETLHDKLHHNLV